MTHSKTGSEARVALQSRDLRLLSEVGTLWTVTATQAMLIAPFGSLTRANWRLLRLVRAGLLERLFVGSVGTGRKAVYALSRQGASLIGVPYRPLRRKGETVGAELFLIHQLAVTDILLTVKHRLVPYTGAALSALKTFGNQPLSSAVPLVPDAYFALEYGGRVLAHFLEVDRGTEVLAVWQKKAQTYVRLAASGEFARLFGQKQFRVLVVAPGDVRLEHLRRTVAAVTEKIFWFSTVQTINRSGLWSAIWLRPFGENPQPLL